MEERLLDEFKKVSVEELVNRINEIVRDKFSILDEENDIEKWNRVPKLLLLSSDKKKQVQKMKPVSTVKPAVVKTADK